MKKEIKEKESLDAKNNIKQKEAPEQEKFYRLKIISLCIGLIGVATAIRHMVVPALILSCIAAISGAILLYIEKKQKQLTQSNFALWSMLLGVAIFLSVVLFDIIKL